MNKKICLILSVAVVTLLVGCIPKGWVTSTPKLPNPNIEQSDKINGLVSHHQKNAAKLDSIRKINQFHVDQLGYMLRKMKSIKEGDRTLLDNTMVVYGAGIGDGDRHNHDDLPILVAGGGSFIKTGRHIKYKNETPMTNLLMTMADRAGVPVETIGDSTGRLDQLF